MLLRDHLAARQCLPLGEPGQRLLAFGALGGIVPAFLVKTEEAVEGHGRAGGAQGRSVGGGDVDRHLIDARAFHLARHRPFPDQLVKPELVGIEQPDDLLGQAEEVGRADRFVGFLGVLGPALVDFGRLGKIGLAVLGGDEFAALGNGFVRQSNAVGPHVADQSHRIAADVQPFIKPLGDPHGPRRAEPELARRLLLQRRGGERRLRVAPDLFALDFADRKFEARNPVRRRLGFRFAAEAELGELLAAEMGQSRRQHLALGVGELAVDGPVFLRLEGFDLGLALADHPQRHRLNPSRRTAARQFAPQHRRQGEADQVVERAACKIGLDQSLVELARVFEGVEHGVAGDLVEYHPLDLDPVEHLAALQDLHDVPRDRLALAVRVGGEIEVIRPFQGLGDFADAFLRPGVDRPGHGEPIVGQDRSLLGRKVADMAVGGEDLEVRAEILVDGLGLGWRLDDDYLHNVSSTYLLVEVMMHPHRLISRNEARPGCPGASPTGPQVPFPAGRWTRRQGTIGTAE